MFYFKFHIGDYRRETQHLTLLEHGVYMTLMSTYYTSEQPLPKDERQLLRLAGARTGEEKQAVLDIVNEFFIPTETHWVHSRIDFELSEYHSKAEANRENGKKGGRPKKNAPQKPNDNPSGFNLLKNKTQLVSETKPNDNPNITLTNKPINPLTYEPIIKDIHTSDKPKRFDFKKALIEKGGSEDSVVAFMAVRKTKKATNTEKAFDLFMNNVHKSNMSLNQVLDICIQKDWKGFDPDWLKSQSNSRGTDNFHDSFYGVGQSPFGKQEQGGLRDVGGQVLISNDDVRF